MKMDQRAEPRFQVNSRASVILLDDLERELHCLLAEISAKGMKLVTDLKLPPDQLIGVEVEHHLVLGDVRHCQPRGGQFLVGAEKVHTLQKQNLPVNATNREKIEALIADFRLGIKDPGSEAGQQLQQLLLKHSGKGEPGPKPRRPSGSWALIASLAAVGILALAALFFAPHRNATLTAEPAKTVAPEVTRPAVSPLSHVSINVTESSWVSACSDGKPAFATLFSPGDTRLIEFSARAVVRVGNAGGVEIAVDGKPLGPLGRIGTLRLIEFTPGAFRYLPAASPAAADCAIN